MQRAEMEELRQRDANLTALQAIGPRKKPRLDGEVSSTAVVSVFFFFFFCLGIFFRGKEWFIWQWSVIFFLWLQAGASGVGATGLASTPLRPRIKRVNMRDMLFYLEQERDTCRSTMLYKAYLKWWTIWTTNLRCSGAMRRCNGEENRHNTRTNGWDRARKKKKQKRKIRSVRKGRNQRKNFFL